MSTTATTTAAPATPAAPPAAAAPPPATPAAPAVLPPTATAAEVLAATAPKTETPPAAPAAPATTTTATTPDAAKPAEAPKVETPPPAPAAKPDDAAAAMVRREIQLQQERDKLKADAAALEKDRQELAALREAAALVKSGKRLDALAKIGVTYDELTQEQLATLDASKPITAGEMKDRLEKVKQEIEAERKAEADRQAKAAEDARKAQAQAEVEAFRAQTLKFVDDGAAAYPLTRAFNAGSLVYDTIVQHAYDTAKKDAEGRIVTPGEVLDFKTAAEKVEAFYRSKVDEVTKKPAAPAVQQTGAPPVTKTEPPKKADAPATLGGIAPATGTGKKPARTDEERMQAAIEAANRARATKT
jgi:hypothetical protein